MVVRLYEAVEIMLLLVNKSLAMVTSMLVTDVVDLVC